jgi:hypothetical protein
LHLAEVDVRRECASLNACFNRLTRRHTATPTDDRVSVTPVTSTVRAHAICRSCAKYCDADGLALFAIDSDFKKGRRRKSAGGQASATAAFDLAEI